MVSCVKAVLLLKYDELTRLGDWFTAQLVPSANDRWKSARGAYATREGLKVDNLGVLLVDDVLTNGATLDACSRALKKAGAAPILGLTVARVRSAGMVPGSMLAAHAGRGQRKPSQVI